MAIKISDTDVIDDTRQLLNITNLKTVGGQAILGTGDIQTSGNYAMRIYTSPGTWTKPTNLRAAKIVVVGGGGSSGPVSAPRFGGGAGGVSILYLDASNIPGPVAVTVGNYGIGTDSVNASGNTSSFGTLASATGGVAGSSTAAGGTGTGGTINMTGSKGGNSVSYMASGVTYNPVPAPSGSPFLTYPSREFFHRGAGGSNILGQGGPSTATLTVQPAPGGPYTSAYLNAVEGTGYGAGASGLVGPFPAPVSPTATANGTAGIVIVEEFY